MNPIRPDSYRAPDRAAWEKTHRATPFPVTLLPFTEEMERVERLIQDDLSTLDAEQAQRIQDEIHMHCECVAALCGVPEEAGCFYFEGRFWIYPVSAILAKS